MDYMQALSMVILTAFLAGRASGFHTPVIGSSAQIDRTIQKAAISPLIIINSPNQNACTNKNGIVLETSMNSGIYQAPVKYSIYLPPCYDEMAARKYPVLYLLHGQTFDNQQWIRLGLADVADELINDQRIVPMIIVLPNDPDWRQPDESPFGRMLVNEMIPFIDQTYPTLSGRQYRAIGGLSRGASWALHLGLTEWQLFARIGAHSLPVFATDSSSIPKWLDKIPPESTPQLYIDIGNLDPELNTARYVERLLSDRHLPHEWHMFTGTHEEEYWNRHLQKYLLWYACEWTVLYYN
jgi:enterochelin esterase-like enzyme